MKVKELYNKLIRKCWVLELKIVSHFYATVEGIKAGWQPAEKRPVINEEFMDRIGMLCIVKAAKKINYPYDVLFKGKTVYQSNRGA